ncbi:MAG: hypothetical protein IKZ82_10210 [Clostridia bacterium]|nr:hypothetical protein [Clostridia bacterium]
MITVIQDGTSECTVENYPIFTGGNDLILFLKKAEEGIQNRSGSVYRIVSGSRSVFYTTLLSKDSDRFATTLNAEWLTKMPNSVPNIGDVDEMWRTVFSALAVNDKLWNTLTVGSRLVYSYDLIKYVIKSYL